MKSKPKLSATVDAWAKALGIQNRTLKVRLTKAGIKTPAGAQITAREIFRALTDDAGAERTALVKAKRIAQEFENRRMAGELVQIEISDKRVWQDILMPLKSELDLIGDKLAGLVNPENPAMAHRVLSEWSEQVLRNIRQAGKVLKPKTQGKGE